MELKDAIGMAVAVACLAIVAMGLWTAGIVMSKPRLRVWSVVVFGFGLLAVGLYGYAAYRSSGPPPDFVEQVPGPRGGEEIALRMVTFPVQEVTARQVVEIGLDGRGEKVGIAVRVLDPRSEQVKAGEVICGPRAQVGRIEFRATMAGNHVLMMQIPKGVKGVRVVAKEQFD